MKKLFFLLPIFFLFFATSFIINWTKSEALFPKNLTALAVDFLVEPELKNSYKTKTIKRVFAQLKKTKGDFRSAQPQLRFVKQIPNGGIIAVAFPTAGVIFFEEKMYDVCVSVGADSLDALAAVLSHELTHCYEKHTWEDHFKRDFQETQMDSLLQDNYLDDEIQADYLGGFLAYAAGYQPFGVMEKLYKKEYAAFNLTDRALAGEYPPMRERIKIAENSEKKLKLLIEYFEMGNWLVATKDYEDALVYFNAVEREFQSREIYNNLGVVSFLAAVDKFDGGVMPYAFPIELDVNTRLGTRGNASEKKEWQIEKLHRAIEYFDKARKMDSFYPIAYLNLGCSQALLGFLEEDFADLDFDEAEISARRALRLAKGDDEKKWQKTIADAHILLGLIEALRNHKTIRPLQKSIDRMKIDKETENMDATIADLKTASKSATEWIDKALAVDETSLLAKMNRSILVGTNFSFSNANSIGSDEQVEEKINNKRIVELSVARDNVLNAFFLREDITFAVKNLPKSKLFINSVSGRQKHGTNFYVANPDYAGSTEKGVKIGDNYEKVIAAYPNPETPVGLANGYFLIYKNPSIIFQFDKENKVKQWAIYRKQK